MRPLRTRKREAVILLVLLPALFPVLTGCELVGDMVPAPRLTANEELMPDLVGQELPEAVRIAGLGGFETVVLPYEDDDIGEQYVTRQEPLAGIYHPIGSVITLTAVGVSTHSQQPSSTDEWRERDHGVIALRSGVEACPRCHSNADAWAVTPCRKCHPETLY